MGIYGVWLMWGIGVVIHGLYKYLASNVCLGQNWEEKKMKELMEQNKYM